MRRQQLLSDRAMKKAAREVAIGHRATQEQQRDEHIHAFKDHYDEKTATHNNFWIEKTLNWVLPLLVDKR